MKLSIIIPVFNDLKAIKLTLESLENQTYNRSEYEVIVVDNGSKDGSFEYLQCLDNIILIKETQHLGSPYSCRNRGIEAAKADILVFLDSTCVPQKDFVEKGLAFAENSDCDLFGGNVRFYFDDHLTGAKLYDSITNIQMKSSIEEKGVAKTANLWVKKHVIDTVGAFIEGERSGDDVGFTSRCISAGMKLVFCETCITYKFARGLKELLKKQFRVGKGKANLWHRNKELSKNIKSAWRYILPISPWGFKRLLKRNQYTKYGLFMIFRAYAASYLCMQGTLWGILTGALRIKTTRKVA